MEPANDNAASDEALNAAVRRGGWANLATTLAAQVLSLLTLAVLYRLLRPEDYGLFALCFLACNLARVFAERGLLAAAIQAPKLTHGEQSALWRRGMHTASTAALVLTLCGGGIEWLTPGRDVALIFITLALSLLAAAVGWQHQVCWERELQFSRLARSRLLSQLVGSLLAVAAAWFGGGAWSLAAQQLAECAALSALLWWHVPWRPSGNRIHRGGIGHYVSFGNRYATSSLFFWLSQNVDTLLVGAVCGKQVLGFYSQAYNLVMKPIYLVSVPVANLMLPTLSRAADRPEAFARWANLFLGFVALVHFPASVGLVLLSQDLMQVLGGDRWLPTAPILAALAGLIASQGLINVCGSWLAAAGKPTELRLASIVIAAMHLLGFVAAWQITQGLQGDAMNIARAIAYSWTIVAAVLVLPYLLTCCRVSAVPLRPLLFKLAGIAVSAVIMAGAVLLVRNALPNAPILRLTAGIVTGVIVFGLLQFREVARIVGLRAR